MWDQFCSWWGYNWYGWMGLIFGIILFAGGYLLCKATFLKEHSKRPGHPNPQRERCPRCDSPVEEAYLRCPECNHKLKTNCPSCGRIVKSTWEICPYCEAALNG